MSFLSIVFILMHFASSKAQTEKYDIFTFTPQPGWQRTQNIDNLQLILQQGNVWCSVGLYSGTNTTGDANQDFQSDWNDLTRSYTINTDVAREQNEVNGWQMILGTASGFGSGQQMNISLITFSGPVRRGTILLLNNDFNNQLESDIAAFMGSVAVINASEAQPISNNQYQAPMGNTYQPPMMSGGGSGSFPTPEEQIVTRSANADGWLVEATNNYIQYSNPEIKVIQYFYVAPEDPNSNTDDEDLFWRKFLANYFSVSQYNKFPNDPYEFLNKVESASGYAAYQPNGQQYYLVWIVNLNLKCSFLAITTHETVYQKYFSHPTDIVALEKYNYFPASTDDLQGQWEESNFAGAQMYYNTGAYAGMSVASTAEEWTFSGNNTRYFASGATGTVGTMNTFTVEEFGTFQLSGNDLTVQVSKPAPKTHEFWCGFVAGKGGLLLKLANKKFTAQIDFLSRKQ